MSLDTFRKVYGYQRFTSSPNPGCLGSPDVGTISYFNFKNFDFIFEDENIRFLSFSHLIWTPRETLISVVFLAERVRTWFRSYSYFNVDQKVAVAYGLRVIDAQCKYQCTGLGIFARNV